MIEKEIDDQQDLCIPTTDVEDYHLLLAEVEAGDEVRPLLLSETLDQLYLEGALEVGPEAEADPHLEEELVARDDRAPRIDDGLVTKKRSTCLRYQESKGSCVIQPLF